MTSAAWMFLGCIWTVSYTHLFMAALITSVMGNTDKVVEYIRECNALGIEVLKPDINKSFSKFSVEGNNIRFGLAAVKNVGVNIIENIINERNLNGEFVDFSDLAKRLDSKDTNKRVIESLIKCGAFDEISENRACLLYTSTTSFKKYITKDYAVFFSAIEFSFLLTNRK